MLKLKNKQNLIKYVSLGIFLSVEIKGYFMAKYLERTI